MSQLYASRWKIEAPTEEEALEKCEENGNEHQEFECVGETTPHNGKPGYYTILVFNSSAEHEEWQSNQ